jgi:hypothetical protein
MSSSQASRTVCTISPGNFGAALEVLGYLLSIAAATLSFLIGWLTCEGAEIITALMLVSLIVIAWKRFDGGRHPCFFFLCTLALFQVGRPLAHFIGGDFDIHKVTLMTWYFFGLPRDVSALALLSIALSAICIYAPCRWNYRIYPPIEIGPAGRYLPYLYLLFSLSVPVQLYKNYCYYTYATSHGGYLVLFLDHGGMASSVPIAVRAISMISLPALVGILVLEGRKRFLYITTAVYFIVALPVMLTGSRGVMFSLVLSLWYLIGVKSSKASRLLVVALVGAGLIWVGGLIGSGRVQTGGSSPLIGPAQFLEDQGGSLNVTEIAIAYRQLFAPHILSYLASELQSAFVAPDQANYVAGKNFNDDVAMFLNPTAFLAGNGTGSAYLAEAYLMGGISGIVFVSVLLGVLLHGMHAHSRNPFTLFVVAMILPDVLWMPRGCLLEWISASVRLALSVVLLLMGWWLYKTTFQIWWVLSHSTNTLSQGHNRIEETVTTKLSGANA